MIDEPTASTEQVWTELIGSWIEDDHEDEFSWNLISCLNRRGEPRVVNWSLALLQNDQGCLRELGAIVLRQHGFERGRPFAQVVVDPIAMALRTETDADAREAMVTAIAWSQLPSQLDPVMVWAHDGDVDIRETVAVCLPSLWPSPILPDRAIDTLIMLSRDLDEHVRDWASYSLGSSCENDTPAVRAALIDRLDDSFEDSDAAAEAAIGLARRGDPLAFWRIERWLIEEEPNWRILDAAGECGRIELLPLLEDLRGAVDEVEETFLSKAIESVTVRAARDRLSDQG